MSVGFFFHQFFIKTIFKAQPMPIRLGKSCCMHHVQVSDTTMLLQVTTAGKQKNI
jgi:hypothetical protein